MQTTLVLSDHQTDCYIKAQRAARGQNENFTACSSKWSKLKFSAANFYSLQATLSIVQIHLRFVLQESFYWPRVLTPYLIISKTFYFRKKQYC